MTQFEPVTFPTAESAYLDSLAAVTLANVSGKEVPRATRVIAVTDALRPTAQPRMVATSPTSIVMIPMKVRATRKAGRPLPVEDGGIAANATFQPIHAKWKRASPRVTS